MKFLTFSVCKWTICFTVSIFLMFDEIQTIQKDVLIMHLYSDTLKYLGAFRNVISIDNNKQERKKEKRKKKTMTYISVAVECSAMLGCFIIN